MAEKKLKLILDTDPGVDDTVCLIYALFDKKAKVELITTVSGNVNIDKATRNLLHLMDLLGVDVPVAKGADKPLRRKSVNAEFIHQVSGLGGYTPPEVTHAKVLKEDAVSAMYRVIMAGDGDVYPIMLGPQTNIAKLIKKHPDVIAKIPKIVIMGGSPYGTPGYPDHISFNLSHDPEAFQVILDSKIPLMMLPSNVGRRLAHLTEDYVNGLKEINDVGKFMHLMYSKYWEPNFPDKRVTTNDVCTLLALTHPKLFTTQKINVFLDLHEAPGKTIIEFTEKGRIEMINGINRKKFLKYLTDELKKLNHIKINL